MPDPTPTTHDRTQAEPLIEIVQNGVGEGWPHVQGKCPGCGSASLFVGLGGYVTCSRLDCPRPCAASVALGVPAGQLGEG